MPCSLKRRGHQALVLGAGAGAGVGQDFGVRRHKTAQGLRVFIVHGADFIGADDLIEKINGWILL